MNTKTCKQCGELKPIEQFRKYYGGRKGTYKTCKICEKINARAKYLKAKGELISEEEGVELGKIHKLYDAQRRVGLQPPRTEVGRNIPLVDSIDEMISKYDDIVDVPSQFNITMVPAELLVWLKCTLTEEPDYYLDEVYEELKLKFRPQLRINPASLLPEYDDTYKQPLEKILERFNEYEDKYYNV